MELRINYSISPDGKYVGYPVMMKGIIATGKTKGELKEKIITLMEMMMINIYKAMEDDSNYNMVEVDASSLYKR